MTTPDGGSGAPQAVTPSRAERLRSLAPTGRILLLVGLLLALSVSELVWMLPRATSARMRSRLWTSGWLGAVVLGATLAWLLARSLRALRHDGPTEVVAEAEAPPGLLASDLRRRLLPGVTSSQLPVDGHPTTVVRGTVSTRRGGEATVTVWVAPPTLRSTRRSRVHVHARSTSPLAPWAAQRAVDDVLSRLPRAGH